MTQEAIPSESLALLRELTAFPIAKLERWSWFAPDSGELDVPPEATFRHTAGALVVELESGLRIGFGGQPSLVSVTVSTHEWPPEDEDFVIDASDEQYADRLVRSLVGRRVRSVKLLTIAPRNELWASRPREAGLVLVFDRGDELVLSQGLHDGSDDFVVITRDEIDPEEARQLTETVLVPEAA